MFSRLVLELRLFFRPFVLTRNEFFEGSVCSGYVLPRPDVCVFVWSQHVPYMLHKPENTEQIVSGLLSSTYLIAWTEHLFACLCSLSRLPAAIWLIVRQLLVAVSVLHFDLNTFYVSRSFISAAVMIQHTYKLLDFCWPSHFGKDNGACYFVSTWILKNLKHSTAFRGSEET